MARVIIACEMTDDDLVPRAVFRDEKTARSTLGLGRWLLCPATLDQVPETLVGLDVTGAVILDRQKEVVIDELDQKYRALEERIRALEAAGKGKEEGT